MDALRDWGHAGTTSALRWMIAAGSIRRIRDTAALRYSVRGSSAGRRRGWASRCASRAGASKGVRSSSTSRAGAIKPPRAERATSSCGRPAISAPPVRTLLGVRPRPGEARLDAGSTPCQEMCAEMVAEDLQNGGSGMCLPEGAWARWRVAVQNRYDPSSSISTSIIFLASPRSGIPSRLRPPMRATARRGTPTSTARATFAPRDSRRPTR